MSGPIIVGRLPLAMVCDAGPASLKDQRKARGPLCPESGALYR